MRETVVRAMARVQLIIPDQDRDRFVRQARGEGLTLSAWLRAAAHERCENRHRAERFTSAAAVEAFFLSCDASEDPEREPDWDEHLRIIAESHRRSSAGT